MRPTVPIFAAAAAVAALALAAASPRDARAEGPLTVASWGGVYERSQAAAYFGPFMVETGVDVRTAVYSGGLREIRRQIAAREVTWDVVDLELSDAMRGCEEGLLEPIDPAALPPAPDGGPAAQDFIPGALSECGAPTVVWSMVVAYDRNRYDGAVLGGADLEHMTPVEVRRSLASARPDINVATLTLSELYAYLSVEAKSSRGARPQRIADFFDLSRFPGKRGMRRVARGNLEIALAAAGVPADEVYALLRTDAGVDKAFATLDTIRDSIVWWTDGDNALRRLADGEVAMTTAFNGRVFEAKIVDERPFEIMWDGQVWDVDVWAIPRGAPNADAARRFVAFATAPERLAHQSSYIAYGPARRSSMEMLGLYHEGGFPIAPHLPTAPENFANALQIDNQFWVDRIASLEARFEAWIGDGAAMSPE